MTLKHLAKAGLVFFCLTATLLLTTMVAQSRAYATETKETANVPRLERSECVTDALTEAGAQCYTFHAQEDREQPNGTIIKLPVAVLESESKASKPADPVFFFPGGPGYSVLGAPKLIEAYREDVGARTLVLMDHRGMIHATPALRCPAYAEVSPYHNIIFTPAVSSSLNTMARIHSVTDVVEQCYQKLVSEGIDVARYNSYAIARDVDAIRRILGYDKIDVYGRSTGGGTALAYLRYFPESVRAAVLVSPWYTNLRNRAPIDELYTIKQRYTDILSLCVMQNPSCRELLPAWFLAVERARRSLDARPYVTTVEVGDGTSKTLYFDGAAFLHVLYLTLPDIYARLPGIVSDIQNGDYASLDRFFQIDTFDPHPKAPRYALGYFLAHICNDMGSNRPNRKDSIYMIQREPAILGFEPPWVCAWWGTDGAVPPEHSYRYRSDKPALAIHGQMDACCGIRWSQHLARTMPNLQFVQLQGAGHTPTTDCETTLIASFLEAPHKAVDDSCKNDVELRPWQLE